MEDKAPEAQFPPFAIGAQRVEELCVGAHVKRLERKDISAALIDATSEKHTMGKEARALGLKVSSEDGVGEAIKIIFEENFMNAATSVIKETRKSKLKKEPPAQEKVSIHEIFIKDPE
ncbi:hypothetical protein PTTG_28715 [Puccinia triticina 1-1 BBBD Race 1]|uniref:Uncharacterized protein n=1 Tax=Puccinia triticina (isolate 1-1 / race 1 (BBBD)) TaxID=630390 RepID=A0A180G9F0_PUCT1|nr:hypothetical protein PTTG_28715 [Puccinia triticina 1-1 BBBD Race 1]WAR61229.1 hypothetical protein PtB15_13B481 [Puccinia triticina]